MALGRIQSLLMGHVLLPAQLGELLLEHRSTCSSCSSWVSHLQVMQCFVNFQRLAFFLKLDRFMFSPSMEPFIKVHFNNNNKWSQVHPVYEIMTLARLYLYYKKFAFFFFSNVNHFLIASGNAAILYGLSRCHQSVSSAALRRCRLVPRCSPCHGLCLHTWLPEDALEVTCCTQPSWAQCPANSC